MSVAQLYITLTTDGELILEGDLLGNGRETLVTDTGGPTTWEPDPAIELPERVFDLTHQTVVAEMQAFLDGGTITDFMRGFAIEHAVAHQRIKDER